MTISSFGPDSAPSRGGGIGRNKVVSRPSPVAPERLLPEVGGKPFVSVMPLDMAVRWLLMKPLILSDRCRYLR